MSFRPLPRDLKKALDLFEAEPARRWTVGALAAACGTAPRTLQKHFRAFIGCGPTQFMRDRRLESARRDLLGAPGATRVTDVATRYGFTHLGRFATRYRKRFGESPSETARPRAGTPPRSAPPLRLSCAERPTIAVQPFELHGLEARRVSTLAEEIAAALSRPGWLRVTAPAAARYHLRGTVHGDDTGRLRVGALLADAHSGRLLWADRWVGPLADLFEFEERVADRITRAIQPALVGAEIDRAHRPDAASPGGWELAMRALPGALSFDARLETQALELLERAMEAAPEDPLPFALASWCHGLLAGHHLSARPREAREAARTLATRAAQLHGSDALTETFVGAGYTLAHDLNAAAVHVERALALDGGSAWAWGRNGWLKAYRGEPEDAIECFRIARDLAPGDPLEFLWAIGIGSAHLEQARYEQAIDWYGKAIHEHPTTVWNDRFRAAAYALAGRSQEARRTLASFSAAFPEVTIAAVKAGLPYSNRFLDRIAEGLAAAGMRR